MGLAGVAMLAGSSDRASRIGGAVDCFNMRMLTWVVDSSARPSIAWMNQMSTAST